MSRFCAPTVASRLPARPKSPKSSRSDPPGCASARTDSGNWPHTRTAPAAQAPPCVGDGSSLTNERRDSNMSSKAAELVTQAKKWATRYGSFTQGEEGSVLTAPLRVHAAWDANDADA